MVLNPLVVPPVLTYLRTYILPTHLLPRGSKLLPQPSPPHSLDSIGNIIYLVPVLDFTAVCYTPLIVAVLGHIAPPDITYHGVVLKDRVPDISVTLSHNPAVKVPLKVATYLHPLGHILGEVVVLPQLLNGGRIG